MQAASDTTLKMDAKDENDNMAGKPVIVFQHPDISVPWSPGRNTQRSRSVREHVREREKSLTRSQDVKTSAAVKSPWVVPGGKS